jgi:GxxExxY protein
MTENALASIVLDICFDIHRQYGPGLFESVYEEIFCYELAKRQIPFTRQESIPIIHDGVRLEVGFRADVIVDEILLLEFKSIEKLADVHFKQVMTYLKITHIKLGLLINFNVPLLKNGIHRIANNL